MSTTSSSSLAMAVVPLGADLAVRPEATGAKAANLARAARAGLPVAPGFVLRTPDDAPAGPGVVPVLGPEVHAAWAALSRHGRRPLVVRSSSSAEDGATTSMAGLFTSRVRVVGWEAFADAVAEVLASASTTTGAPARARMAVLVQRHVEPRTSGVLFGVDPVTGRTDRRVLAAVAGHPGALVSGQVAGTRYVVGPWGRVHHVDDAGGDGARLGAAARRAVLALGRRADRTFGGPQDVEWARDSAGRLWLLQSRPVTAVGARGRGPRLGSGPVAETFPDPLTPLEEDLWVEPLRRATTTVLSLTRAVPARQVRRSPVVTTVGGRVAADLELFGATPPAHPRLHRLDPRPSGRRLGAAWQVGRLRAALGGLSGDLVDRIDAELAAAPHPVVLSDEELLGTLVRAGQALVALHGHEELAGALDRGPAGPTGASVALAALAAGRRAGLDDDQLVAARPEVLVLVAPSVARPGRLPPTPRAPTAASGSSAPTVGDLAPREALRLRVRWVHELTVAVAREVGARLEARGVLGQAAEVAWLRLDELPGALASGVLPPDLAARRGAPVAAPLPVAFRLADDGRPVTEAVPSRRGARAGVRGVGAGGGRGAGPVHHGPHPPAGAVLVVRTLDPGLAADLAGLAGLVAETGSVLSHLAILAREAGVPTVVALPGARERFAPGTVVVVDGTVGTVEPVDGTADPAAAPRAGPAAERAS